LQRSILGSRIESALRSTSRQRTPRRPRLSASVRPTGPAPTIRTSVLSTATRVPAAATPIPYVITLCDSYQLLRRDGASDRSEPDRTGGETDGRPAELGAAPAADSIRGHALPGLVRARPASPRRHPLLHRV